MATRPWSWRTPDARRRDLRYARQVEEERAARLDEQDARRQMQLEQAMQREQARGADLDRRDDIGRQMEVEEARSADLDKREASIPSPTEEHVYFKPGETMPPMTGEERRAFGLPVPTATPTPADGYHPMAPLAPLAPGFTEEDVLRRMQEQRERSAPYAGYDPMGRGVEEAIGAVQRVEDPIAASALQAVSRTGPLGGPAMGPAQQVREMPMERQPIGEELVNPVSAWLGDEEEQRKVEEVLAEAGLPAMLMAYFFTSPLNFLPVVGFTKADDFLRVLRQATRVTGKARQVIIRSPRFQSTIRAIASEAGGPRVPGGRFRPTTPEGMRLTNDLPTTTAIRQRLADIDAELAKPSVKGGRPAMLTERARLQAQADIDEILASGLPVEEQFRAVEAELEGLRIELQTRGLPFRGRWTSRKFVPQEKDMPMGGLSAEERAAHPSAAQSAASRAARAEQRYPSLSTGEVNARERVYAEFVESARFEPVEEPLVGRARFTPEGETIREPTYATEGELAGVRARQGELGIGPGERPIETAGPMFEQAPTRVTPEPRVGALEGGPPRPPREPPIGPRGPDPDDAQFRRIQDVAIKGEKPEMTLIRRHEGALQTARREAQIQVEEGNRLLRDANLGQSFRGTVAPRAGQTDEFDELYRFLHNPSRVEAGELVVPERLRPAYDKLRGLTDWEQAARLDFDPKMALIEDYFYRGWKPPEGMFAEGAPTRGPLGRKPGFRLPRVDATFEEMRAAGFEPLHWNPFEQWRNSRMMGVRYREQMRLVEDIKSLGLAEVHTGGPIPEGWRVPRVGSAFEGKPFAVVDEAGGARPMFTRRWIVPDTMADRLENIYGVAPQLGTVELAGRAVNLARVVDALVFIPKRAKLIASVFQHVDFLTRSHLGAWTGMVDALRHGRPISAVKHLAVWPNSARKILQATVSPGYRQNLRRMALDTSPLVPGRPGLTMRSVSEAGLSLQDVTILPANIDQIAREVAQEAVAAKVIKAPPRALAGFERVHRQGLFQGVYPAAILTDVQNNIAPIMVRNYPHLTDAQLAGQVAKVASTKYSTIPASMSAVQNRTLRGVLTRTFFSMGETEGLLRQATGALRGPQAAFWRDHWLGVYVGLIATANAIHFASTGEPLPFARYSPVSRNKWGPLPIGYNRDFASPNIPLTGRSGTEITLDLVGQLDTAFRILDPASFIGARESVPVRTAVNQIKGTDFFGAPIDEVGPGGIVSRTSQLIFDMFAPIGVGQAALQLARENIQGVERIIRPGEDRLGTAGTAVQATGVNLRAETTPQLLDRIRAEVMQEKGIGGRYEDIKATDAPLANEIDDEVEARIGPELEMRRETAEIRGQTTPQSQFFGEQEVSREQQKEEQLADDVKLSSGQWEGDVWRDKFRDRQRDFYNRREGLKQAFKIEFEDKEAPSGSVNAAIDAYFDVNIDDYAQPDGETNWDGFFKARDAALGGLSSSDRARVMKFIRKFDTPTVKEFRKAQEIVDKVYETPKYVGLSLEEGEAVDRILFEIVPRMQTAQLRQGAELERGQAVMAAISFVKDPDVAKFLLTNFGPRLSVRRRRRGGRTITLEAPSVVNPKRDAILLENQDILALFYPDLLAQQLSREQEAGLGEQAFAAVQG